MRKAVMKVRWLLDEEARLQGLVWAHGSLRCICNKPGPSQPTTCTGRADDPIVATGSGVWLAHLSLGGRSDRLPQVFAQPWVIAQQRDLVALVYPFVPSPVSGIFRFFPSGERRIKSVAIAVFGGATWLLQRSIGSPLAPEPGNATAGERVWMQLAEIGWWILGARVAVGIVRLVVVLENQPRETKIIWDLLAGVIYTATTLAVVAALRAACVVCRRDDSETLALGAQSGN